MNTSGRRVSPQLTSCVTLGGAPVVTGHTWVAVCNDWATDFHLLWASQPFPESGRGGSTVPMS